MALVRISYPLYSSFLPVYLATRGANISAPDVHGVYRDNLISNCVSMGGPLIAGALLFCFPWLGRRGVLFIGGVASMAFLFGYTQIKTRAQNVALSSISFASMYIYYSALYAYTPEVFLSSSSNRKCNCYCLYKSYDMYCACYCLLLQYFVVSPYLGVWCICWSDWVLSFTLSI